MTWLSAGTTTAKRCPSDPVHGAADRPDGVEESAGQFGDEPVRHRFAEGVAVGLQPFQLDHDQAVSPLRPRESGEVVEQRLAVGQAGDPVADRALPFEQRRRLWRRAVSTSQAKTQAISSTQSQKTRGGMRSWRWS